MVTLFKHGISFRYTFIEKTNFLTSLKTKIKEIKLIKMKRKHLLFKEAVCKNRESNESNQEFECPSIFIIIWASSDSLSVHESH